jgi:hypothetical protein
MPKLTPILISLPLWFATSAVTLAGPIADAGQKAEALLQGGDTIGAVEALDAGYDAIWQATPLVFRKTIFVDSASGFGIFAAKESAAFAAGEPIKVYVEPVGFAYGKNAIGGSEIGFDVDFELTDPSGASLFAKENFLQTTTPVRYHNREFQMTLTINLTGMSPGSYIAKFNVKDQNSEKTGTFDLPFEVKS